MGDSFLMRRGGGVLLASEVTAGVAVEEDILAAGEVGLGFRRLGRGEEIGEWEGGGGVDID